MRFSCDQVNKLPLKILTGNCKQNAVIGRLEVNRPIPGIYYSAPSSCIINFWKKVTSYYQCICRFYILHQSLKVQFEFGLEIIAIILKKISSDFCGFLFHRNIVERIQCWIQFCNLINWLISRDDSTLLKYATISMNELCSQQLSANYRTSLKLHFSQIMKIGVGIQQ